jgi:hypothetical protein
VPGGLAGAARVHRNGALGSSAMRESALGASGADATHVKCDVTDDDRRDSVAAQHASACACVTPVDACG